MRHTQKSTHVVRAAKAAVVVQVAVVRGELVHVPHAGRRGEAERGVAA